MAAAQGALQGTAIALMGLAIGNALGQVHATHRGIVSAWTAIATPTGGAADGGIQTLSGAAHS